MSFFDAIVIGAGPAGVFSAYALRGKRVLLLDVGHRPPASPVLEGNLYELRKSREDLFEAMIGGKFEGLHNLVDRNISLKLKSPLMAYVVRDSERLAPVVSDTFDAVISLAQGGLANAWGAGVYRFTARDLEGWPVSLAELDPFYDELTRHIGVSGAADDLAPYFGSATDLLPPLRLSVFAQQLLNRYNQRKRYFNRRGILVGYPRLAVLTVGRPGRDAYAYDNLEFFRPGNPAIYNPAFTLAEMVAAGRVVYRPGCLAMRYREAATHVEVTARSLTDDSLETFQGKTLLLAAGALNSARIVLESSGDYESRLPILDNPMSCIPLFRLSRVGAPLDVHDSSLAQLNVVYDAPETSELVQATLYASTGPLRSDVLFQLPMSVSANLAFAKYVAPAMGVLMVFHPERPRPGNCMRLRADGALEVHYDTPPRGRVEGRLIRAFRRAGAFSSRRICQYPRMGNGLHYAGTIPMKQVPGRYEVDRNGLLWGAKRVYVVDGACFPVLPAKNLTFTIMANAMRVATRVRSALECDC